MCGPDSRRFRLFLQEWFPSQDKKVLETSLLASSGQGNEKRSLLPPPVLYRTPIGPAPGPIIVQPAPIQPPLIPYPSAVSQTFVQPIQVPTYPPQPQGYASPSQIPRYPSHSQQGSYIGPQAERPAPRHSWRTDRRYSNEQYPHHHRDRRYSLEEKVIAGHSPRVDSRRALTPEPQNHYRPRYHRSVSTSRRMPEHQYHNHQAVFEEEGTSSSSAEEQRRRYVRPSHRRAASTSAQRQQHYLSDPTQERKPDPPRRSFDHSSRDHLDIDHLHPHSHHLR
ncbi:hypothetical protein I204_01278 [Kwoniella mangroviensis CBS 8886]|nr:hypothetical protein I204_01278 [Kwoniella mangroviensis CBS 8886]